MLPTNNTILDITSVQSFFVISLDLYVAVAGIIAKLSLVCSITEACCIAVTVVLRVCQCWVATARESVSLVITVGGYLAIDGEFGAVAISACVVPSIGWTTCILRSKIVAVGVTADCCAR